MWHMKKAITLVIFLLIQTLGSSSIAEEKSLENQAVPIILRLNIPDDQKNSPDHIAKYQAEVLTLISDYNPINVKQSKFLPQLSLTINSDAIPVLESSDLIKSIHSDGLAKPITTTRDKPCDNTSEKKN